MGQLVFQATLGGQVNLVGPNTASTYNINVPAVAGTMVTTGDTGTVSSTMLASSLSLTTPNIGVATGTSLKVSAGFYSTSSSSFTYTDGIVVDYTTGLGRISVGTSDGLAFYNAGVATTELMRLDSSGNLGIGTSTINAKLHVNNSSGGGASSYFTDSTTGTSSGFQVGLDSGHNAILNMQYNAQMLFSTNNAERMRIDSAGNLLVGTTTLGGKLNIVQASAQGSAGAMGFFQNTFAGDSSYFGLYVAKFANDSTTAQRYIGFSYNNNAAGGGQINANGAGAAAFGSFSDLRLKENVVDLPAQLASIMALRPVEFDYKTGGHQIGFIAQEIQQVYPDAVSEDGSEDNYLTLTGWSKTEARLVKAIQEQQALINNLTERLVVLEAPKV